MFFELITGDFLFDPRTGQDWSRDEDHLALMMELLGDYPSKEYALSGRYSRDFFNNSGKLKHIKSLKFWSLRDVLTEKYNLSAEDSQEITSFLMPMLAWEPCKRQPAAEALKHSWVQPNLNEVENSITKVDQDRPGMNLVSEADVSKIATPSKEGNRPNVPQSMQACSQSDKIQDESAENSLDKQKQECHEPQKGETSPSSLDEASVHAAQSELPETCVLAPKESSITSEDKLEASTSDPASTSDLPQTSSEVEKAVPSPEDVADQLKTAMSTAKQLESEEVKAGTNSLQPEKANGNEDESVALDDIDPVLLENDEKPSEQPVAGGKSKKKNKKKGKK